MVIGVPYRIPRGFQWSNKNANRALMASFLANLNARRVKSNKPTLSSKQIPVSLTENGMDFPAGCLDWSLNFNLA
jgi:hypothetical protein